MVNGELQLILLPAYSTPMPVTKPPFTIRPATRADIRALHALVESAYRGDSARLGWTHEADLLDGQRTDPESLTAIIDDPDEQILVALDGSDIIGCVQIARKEHGTSYLGLLSVDPRRQATGLGKQLITAAERAAATHFGAHAIEMTVIKQRTELIDYYFRRGYSPTGEERPFPHGDVRFGLPKTSELVFVVLSKHIA